MVTQREDVSERQSESLFDFDNVSESIPAAETAERTESTGIRRPKKGVYIPLDNDGNIDVKRFKPESREKFEKYIVGKTATGDKVSTVQFAMDREQIPILYDGIAMAIQQVGKMFFKWPGDLTALMVYSEESKENLKEPTAKVIEKFAPAWLLKNQEIVFLAMAFSTETKKMVEQALTQYIALHPEKLRQPAPQTVEPPPVQEQPQTEAVAA